MMSVREGVNLQFYGRPAPARSLLLDDAAPPPAAASALYAALDALMDWASSLPAPAGFLTTRCVAGHGPPWTPRGRQWSDCKCVSSKVSCRVDSSAN